MFRNLLDKLPAWPTVLISGYLFIKPVLPQPHLWQKLQMFLDGQPMGHVEYIDIAVHTFMGLVFFARVGRMLEVAMSGGAIDEEAEAAEQKSPQGKDADA